MQEKPQDPKIQQELLYRMVYAHISVEDVRAARSLLDADEMAADWVMIIANCDIERSDLAVVQDEALRFFEAELRERRDE